MVAPVDPADTAGGEDPDAGPVGGEHRGGNSGRSKEARGQHGAHVPEGGLGHPVGGAESFEFVVGQPHPEQAVHQRDGCGHGAPGAHEGLAGERRLHVSGIGHSVGDDRRLEGHDRSPGGQGIGDLVGEV